MESRVSGREELRQRKSKLGENKSTTQRRWEKVKDREGGVPRFGKRNAEEGEATNSASTLDESPVEGRELTKKDIGKHLSARSGDLD